MLKAKTWRQVRAEAVAFGCLTDISLRQAQADHDARISEWRLAELNVTGTIDGKQLRLP